jgi:hypothetical protein
VKARVLPQRAQQGDRRGSIGALTPRDENDPEQRAKNDCDFSSSWRVNGDGWRSSSSLIFSSLPWIAPGTGIENRTYRDQT